MHMQLIETSGIILGISDTFLIITLCNWGLRDRNQNVVITCLEVDASDTVIEYFTEYSNFKVLQD